MNREREKSIMEIAVKEKTVTVKDLAHRLYASEPSIRRDLCSLEKQYHQEGQRRYREPEDEHRHCPADDAGQRHV